MSVVQSNIQVTPFACRDVIGVKGLCSSTYPYNLDTLGISLPKAAKLADSAKITGKQLIEESVDAAWGRVFSDLKIDGFKVAGVNKTYFNEFGEDTTESGTYSETLTRGCDIEKFFFSTVNVKVIGTLSALLTITYNGSTQTLYNDTLTDEELIVNIDNDIIASSIVLRLVTTGSGTLVKTTSGTPINYNGYLACSEKLFFCKYWQYLIPAVMPAAAAMILNNSLFNDRYNDIITYKKDEIALRIAQLDSSLNLLNTENQISTSTTTKTSGNSTTKTRIGIYQAEIEKINLRLKSIVKDQHCTCCFNCDQIIQSQITLP